jgi:hypothetical protein
VSAIVVRQSSLTLKTRPPTSEGSIVAADVRAGTEQSFDSMDPGASSWDADFTEHDRRLQHRADHDFSLRWTTVHRRLGSSSPAFPDIRACHRAPIVTFWAQSKCGGARLRCC